MTRDYSLEEKLNFIRDEIAELLKYAESVGNDFDLRLIRHSVILRDPLDDKNFVFVTNESPEDFEKLFGLVINRREELKKRNERLIKLRKTYCNAKLIQCLSRPKNVLIMRRFQVILRCAKK